MNEHDEPDVQHDDRDDAPPAAPPVHYGPDKLAALKAAAATGEDLDATDVIALGLACAHDSPAPAELAPFVRAAERWAAAAGVSVRFIPEAEAPADGFPPDPNA